MIRAHKRNSEAAKVSRATGIHRVELLQAPRNQPHAQIVISRHSRAVRFGNIERVADVIAVTVGQHDMVHAFNCRRLVGHAGWSASEKRIDPNCVAGKSQSKSGMAVSGDLHDGPSGFAGRWMGSTIVTPTEPGKFTCPHYVALSARPC